MMTQISPMMPAMLQITTRGQRDQRIGLLVRESPPLARRPNDQGRRPLQVLLGNRAEITAVLTHGVVIPKHQIMAVSNFKSKGLDKGFVQAPVFLTGAP